MPLQPSKRLFLLLPAVIAIVGVLLGSSPAKQEVRPEGARMAPSKLAQMVWLQGEWYTQRDGDTLEEVWSAPSRDSIMGMFRWIKGGSVWMFELITITVDGTDVTFRLKHFDRSMVGWEEKDESLTYTLKSLTDTEAVFENPARDHPRRFIYRLEAADRLVVQLEGIDGERTTTTEFRYRKR